MKKELILHSTLNMSKSDWLKFRAKGIGGSESGTVLGLNKYQSSIELFYSKLMPPYEKDENEAMHWGKALEDLIADRWQYWENDPAGMIANFNAEKIVRRCRRLNAYVINPSFPHLFASLDRIINKNNNEMESVLECKTISGYVVDQWENGVPPSYVIQLQQYLLITELNNGEIALLKDGRFMEVLPFEKNETICSSIINRTNVFWQRVTHARDILAKHGVEFYDDQLSNEIKQAIAMHEPEPDGSEAYADFLNKRWTSRGTSVPGTDFEYNMAMEILKIDESLESLKTQKTEYQNKIKAKIQDNDEITFGAGGKITWRTNKNGVRALRIGIKPLVQPALPI